MVKTPNSNPRLTLVGAGPGDEDLITLKGVKALNRAKVVMYDALVNKSLLAYAPDDALRVYVGKRPDRHSHKQEDINKMIVNYASEYGHVVRLKGGDPSVFGRSSEEIEYVTSFGIPVSIVPGISSAISLPPLAGFPLTKRGVSESFWVVTATTKTGRLSDDITLVAQSSATAIVLMGISKLEYIVDIYRKQNKHDLSIAIIQNGTLPNEKMIRGKIKNIIAKKTVAQITSPAVIIIGEVVKYQNKAISILQSKNVYG